MRLKRKKDKIDGIPSTGRIGRLAGIIERKAGKKTLHKVMRDVDQYTLTSNPSKKAAWLRVAIEQLEQLVGAETAGNIMQECGKKCCGQRTRERAKKLMLESDNIEDFVNKLNKEGLGGRRLKVVDQNTITGGYDHCYCGQVRHTEQPFSNKTYCLCSVGWYKQLFEHALERSVEVEITQSIISGAETCEFIIHL